MYFIGQMSQDDSLQDISNPVWQHPDFPSFYRSEKAIRAFEASFKRHIAGLRKTRHGEPDLRDLLVSEVFSNSQIEGVVLDEKGITESLLGNISGDTMKKEQAAVDLMKLGVERANRPLGHSVIKALHGAIFKNEHGGKYMGGLVIVSGGRIDRRIIVDRGVPSERVDGAMGDFIDWYNGRDKNTPLYNAVRGHLHFESIHPFHDGNGRVGRTLMNMGLMSDLGLAFPLSLSRAIRKHKDGYYGQFGAGNLDLTDTVKVFSPILIDAVKETQRMMSITDLRKRAYAEGMNQRQKRVFERLCRYELTTGFEGKFTNEKYRKIAKISEDKTAMRDLRDLVEKEILTKHGRLKGTSYRLALDTSDEAD